MSRLTDLSADQILAELEKRGDAVAELRHKANLAEWKYDRAKAAAFIAYNSQGNSIEKAKALALENDTVVGAFSDWQEAEFEKDKAFLSLERARIAVDLYRTEKADQRKV